MPTAKFMADYSDFDRAAAKIDGWLDVMEQKGAKAGQGIAQTEQAAASAAPQFNTLRDTMNQFDGALASVGIHIGPQVRALGELSDAAGKSFSQVGAIATAGLALGAGVAGWNIGRLIAEFFDLDRKIAAAATGLGLFGDAAAEAAGAKADVLARATRNAGKEVTDFNEALKINAAAFQEWQHNAGAFKGAADQSAAAVATWRAEIERVKKDGNLDALTHDLASQNFTLDELSKRYGIHVEALQLMTRETKIAEDAAKKHAEAQKKAAEDIAKAQAALFATVQKLEGDYHDFTLKGLEDLDVSRRKASQSFFESTVRGYDQIEKAQAALNDDIAKATMSSSDYQIHKIWEVVAEQEKAFQGTIAQRQEFNRVTEELAQRQTDILVAKARQLEADLLTIVVGTGPTAPNAGAGRTSGFSFSGTAIPADILRSIAGMDPISGGAEAARQMANRGLSFDKGGPVLRDGPIFAHAGEFVVPRGGGAGMTTINHFYITQPLGTPDDIARAVSESTTSRLRNLGIKFPTGA